MTEVKTREPVLTLYNTMSANVVGYCKKHKAAVTPAQLKRKKCLGKRCGALERYDDHPLWAQRKWIKENKKKR